MRNKNNRRNGFLEKTIFCLLILGPPRPRSLTALEADGKTFDPFYLIEIFVVAFGFFAIILNFLRKRNLFYEIWSFLKFSKAAMFYIAFLALAFLSSLYSYYPRLTLFYSIKSFVFFTLAAIIAIKNKDNIFFLPRLVVISSLFMSILQVFLYFYDDSLVGVYNYIFGYRLTGGWLGGYGIYFAIAGILFLFLTFAERKISFLNLFALLLSTYFLYLSKTRQNYIFFLIVLFALTFFYKFSIKKTAIVIFVIVFVEFAFNAYLLKILIRDEESFFNLSERLLLIETFYDHANLFTFFGNGYYAASKYWLDILGFAQLGIGSAHESVSAILLEVGILGFIFLSLSLIFLITSLFKTLSCKIKQIKTVLLLKIYLAIVFYLIISMIVNAHIIYANFLWINTLIGAEIAAYQLKRYRLENVSDK